MATETKVAPAPMAMTDVGGGLLDTIGAHQTLYIAQTVNLAEAATCGCCNQRNKFWAFPDEKTAKLKFANNDKQAASGKPKREDHAVFYAEEHSNGCERCFCNNRHGFALKFYDAKTKKVVNTLERPGCCSGKPCLCCMSCAGPCREEMRMYKGDAGQKAGAMVGELAFTSMQSNCCSEPCGVSMATTHQGDTGPSLKVQAPCFFGGCKSCCCGDEFPITDMSGKIPKGHLTKPTPDGCGGCIKEICTDADDYSLHFAQDATGPEKMAMVAGAFQSDMMLFAQDRGPLFCESVYNCDVACTICNCYVCGLFCPYTCSTKTIRRNYICCCSKYCIVCQVFPGCGQIDVPRM